MMGDLPASRTRPTKAQWAEYEQKCWFNAKVLLKDAGSRGMDAFEQCVTTLEIDDVVGGLRTGLRLGPEREIQISMHTVRVADRAIGLVRQMGEIPATVLEIGGGHGRFVRDIGKLGQKTRIYYVDLVFNLALAARCLTKVFPGEVKLAWDDAQPVPDDGRIVLVPPWRIAEIPVAPDVCCNFLSFQHMEAGNLRYYGDALVQIGCGRIFHRNRIGAVHRGEVTLEPGCMGPDWVSKSRTEISVAEVNRAGANGMPGQMIRRLPTVEEVLIHRSHDGEL
jgi:hypothetical protein